MGLGAGAGASGDSSGFFGAARRAIGAVGVGGALGFAASLAGAGDVVIALVLLVALALAGRGVGSRLVGFDFVASADAGSGGFASALEVVAETAGVAAEEIFVGKSPEDLALSRRLAGA